MLKIYNEAEHYDLIKKWWQDHNWLPIDKNILPKTGLIVNDCVAGFLYQTDSSLAWVEWIVSDKNSDKKLRKESLYILINELTNIAKDMGFTHTWSWLENENLIKYFTEQGYVFGDRNMTNVIKRL